MASLPLNNVQPTRCIFFDGPLLGARYLVAAAYGAEDSAASPLSRAGAAPRTDARQSPPGSAGSLCLARALPSKMRNAQKI